ncbi:MAG: beta-lactamase family protein [Rhodospirillaceae bacterium]|nr:beta-lactamase family protein [Rhodospirillaceae bacterium]
MKIVRNPRLDVDASGLSDWNKPENRRWGFHHLWQMCRYGLIIRSPYVLALEAAPDSRIPALSSVREMTSRASFSGLAVVQHDRLLFEAYAPDFGPDQPHSMQSITKTSMHFVIGRLVDEGKIDPEKPVSHYIPEIGSGYAAAKVQQVLDMDVLNNFTEDYAGSYEFDPQPGVGVSYLRQEIAMGWRLPPEGESGMSMRGFTATLVSDDVENRSGLCEYRSPNTDLLGWIAERVSGRTLRDLLIEIVEAAGIEGCYYISTDCDGVPVVSGGGAMTARDLARFGQLFVRWGAGVDGRQVAGQRFMKTTRNGRGPTVNNCPYEVRYSNQTYTNGSWFGHPGFAGQFLMAHPETGLSIAYFGVLETPDAIDDHTFNDIMGMSQDIIATLGMTR